MGFSGGGGSAPDNITLELNVSGQLALKEDEIIPIAYRKVSETSASNQNVTVTLDKEEDYIIVIEETGGDSLNRDITINSDTSTSYDYKVDGPTSNTIRSNDPALLGSLTGFDIRAGFTTIKIGCSTVGASYLVTGKADFRIQQHITVNFWLDNSQTGDTYTLDLPLINGTVKVYEVQK